VSVSQERSLGFNKACEIEDFSDPELAEVMRDVCRHKRDIFGATYPKGAEIRKDWEVAMAVRALRHHGALRPGARILGVGAGIEDTLFYLTKHVDQVFVVDRYIEPNEWAAEAPLMLLLNPERLAPYDFDSSRLVVQHMDGRFLRFPSGMFDGVFSSGSIEHFGAHVDVAHAAYEMGRVLKPGGVLTLSTELKISGPVDGTGWEGTLVLSPEDIRHFIVEASGLALVDPLNVEISRATRETRREIEEVVDEFLQHVLNKPPATVDWKALRYPQVMLATSDYVFSSVHLTLQKPMDYPVSDNGWARPPTKLVESIQREYAAIAARASTRVSGPPPDEPAVVEPTPQAPMISYALNREDVVLRRALPGESGFYIDVGAWEPVAGSTTKYFYDRGWRGVNVEPAASPFERLGAERPRDINLNVALGRHPGTAILYEAPPGYGVSTLDPDQARSFATELGIGFVEREVDVLTLAQICEAHCAGPIDFLSVDVEGSEAGVLGGADWVRWRPRIIVVEATEPRTGRPTHGEWEHVLLEADYEFITFDGLNRFYVRSEDSALGPLIRVPPNAFDQFVPYEQERLSQLVAATALRVDVGPTALAVATKLTNFAKRYPKSWAAAKRTARRLRSAGRGRLQRNPRE
jgi:FkbM family methyltransferase